MTLIATFGPRALVTGASDGIGRAIATDLAAQGFALTLVARRGEALDDLAQDLTRRHGVGVKVLPLDLTRPEDVAALASRAGQEEVGLLVSAAGFGSIGPFLARDPATETAMVDLNCRTTVTLAHAFGQPMAARGKGGMILFSSVMGFQGAPGSVTYAATKGFVQSFAEALGIELAPRGVRILCVAPGPVGTGFATRAGMQMGMTARPEEIAKAALAALPKGGTVRPGALSKLLGWGLGTLPRPLRVRLMGRITASMGG